MLLPGLIFTGTFIMIAIRIAALVALLIILLIGLCKFFQKCGLAGWKGLVPLYGRFVLLNEICGLHWGFAAASIIITILLNANWLTWVLNAIIFFLAGYNLATKTGRDNMKTAIFITIFQMLAIAFYGLFDKQFNYDPTIEVDEMSIAREILK